MKIRIGDRTIWLNYHHLYYFRVISSEGSIAKASAKLGLGQPTLSAQLKQFEASLGAQLFDRKHKRLVLNETGKIVQEYAAEIFKMGAEMVEVVHDKLPTKRVHVQIGALDSVPKHITLALSQAAMKLGNCVVSILEGTSDELLRELANHRIDLFVSNAAPSSAGKDIYARSIMKAPVVISGAARFKGLKKNFPKSLSHCPFILPTSHSKLRQDLEHYFKLAGIHVDVVAETQDTAIQKLMGIEGIGLVPMALPAVKGLLSRKELFELGTLPGIEEEVFLIAASRRIANPISSALMKSFSM